MKTGYAAMLAMLCALGAANASAAPVLDCKTGPADKVFGGTHWLVYGCSDNKSLAIVSAPNSPASPFVFFLTPEKLTGEGTGSKAATDAARDDLAKLSNQDAAALFAQTRTAPQPSSK